MSALSPRSGRATADTPTTGGGTSTLSAASRSGPAGSSPDAGPSLPIMESMQTGTSTNQARRSRRRHLGPQEEHHPGLLDADRATLQHASPTGALATAAWCSGSLEPRSAATSASPAIAHRYPLDPRDRGQRDGGRPGDLFRSGPSASARHGHRAARPPLRRFA